MKVRFTVFGAPVPMPRARVVRGKSGKAHAFTPEEATRAKARIKSAARLVALPFYVGPLTLEVWAYLPADGVAFWKRGSGDADNYAKLAQDALEDIAFGNDAAIVDLSAHKRPATDGRPRLEITLDGTPGERPEPKPRRTPKRLAPGRARLMAVPALYRKGVP